jgi:hypothetical protein
MLAQGERAGKHQSFFELIKMVILFEKYEIMGDSIISCKVH